MNVKWEVIKFFIKRELTKLIEKIRNIFARKGSPPKPQPPDVFKPDEKIKDIGP